ncbi:guanine nucleotide-binding protein subunit beta-like protein 1 [Lineus longissimus]|uniref:guanine nucleotide-binding protein subunit beta-like protein 1 n=1 Tax=Lineus longissimus TaxID=88925 RepID=UPI002B4D25A6
MTALPPPDPAFILRGTSSQVTAVCAYDPFIITGTQGGKVQIWDLKSRRIIHQTFDGGEGQSILSIRTIRDQIITHCRDGALKMWTFEDKKLVSKGTIHCHSGTFLPMEIGIYNEESVMMIPGPETSEVDIIYLNKKEIASRLLVKNSGEKGYGLCMCGKFVYQNSVIVIGYENGCIALWDISKPSARELDKLSCHSETVTALDYSEKVNRGISGSADDKIAIWNLTKDNKLTAFRTLSITNPGVNAIKIRQDSKIFATGGWDHNIRIFGMKKLQQLAVLSFHRESISKLDFGNDFLLFASSLDQTVSAWSIYR